MIDYKKISNEDLFGMCLAGDGGAWTYVYNYALKICKSRKWNMGTESVDIASEVTKNLIKAVARKKGGIREQDKFRNLITVATVNKIKDLLKSTYKNTVLIEDIVHKMKRNDSDQDHQNMIDNVIGSKKADQIESIERLEIFLLIDQALEQLSLGCQYVLKEYFKYKVGIYDDYNELSKVLNMSVSLLATRISRCIQKMLVLPEMKTLKEYI